MRVEDFKYVWLVNFAYERPPGEGPATTGLEALELRSGRRLLLGPEVAGKGQPPYPVGEGALVVVYGASAVLGCHVSQGWPTPANVLDLHAEYRLATSGLDAPKGDGLADALAHFGLSGEGLDGLGKLLQALLPTL